LSKLSANEFPTGILRTVFVDFAAMARAEGTGFARINLVAANFNLEPTVAAGRATPAGPETFFTHTFALP
jgi:hypothetical protein